MSIKAKAEQPVVRMRYGAGTFEVQLKSVLRRLREWVDRDQPGAAEALAWLEGRAESGRRLILGRPPLAEEKPTPGRVGALDPRGLVRNVYQSAVGGLIFNKRYVRVRCPKCKQDYTPSQVKSSRWSRWTRRDPVRGWRGGGFGFYWHCPRRHRLVKCTTSIRKA
ncbi:MAG: hypothetical protein L0Z62_30435 [Gemmataceae bacterium]|nr:hypothetical protein [Gemmataceae bacterium]